jgi:hypothetical protein
MVRPKGLEPLTHGLGNRCSVHLSYGRPMSFFILMITSKQNGAPAGIRTPDLQIRSLLLYPAELRAHKIIILSCWPNINGGERGIRTLETAQHRLLA